MQDNSFNRRIEQQLHDINIEPSGHVWTAVEKELDKRKRKFPLFWWLLLLLLIGIGPILYLKNNETARDEFGKPSDNLTPKQVNTSAKNDVQASPQNTITAAGAEGPTQASLGSSISSSVVSKTSSAPTVIPGSSNENNKPEKAKRIVKASWANAKQHLTVTPSTSENFSNSDSTNKQFVVDETTKAIETARVSIKEDIIDSVVREGKHKENVQAESPLIVGIPKPSDGKKENNTKWSTEWIAGGGSTELRALDFSKANEDLMYTPGNTGSNPIPGANSRVRNEYSFKNGIYLGAGFQLNKIISKRFSVLTGFHYNYQSTGVDKRVMIDTLTNIGTSMSYTTISSKLYKEKLSIHSVNFPLLVRYAPTGKFTIIAGLYNNVSISSNWKDFSNVLGEQKKYLPVLHLNPSFSLNKLSAGPFLNVGLEEYKSGQNLVNYGLMLRYNSKE